MDKPPIPKAEKPTTIPLHKTRISNEPVNSSAYEIEKEWEEQDNSARSLREDIRWETRPSIGNIPVPSSPILHQRRSFNSFPRPWQAPCKESAAGFSPLDKKSNNENRNINIKTDISTGLSKNTKISNEKFQHSISVSNRNSIDTVRSNDAINHPINTATSPLVTKRERSQFEKGLSSEPSLKKSSKQEWPSGGSCSLEDPRPTKFRVAGERPIVAAEELASTPKISEENSGDLKSSRVFVSEKVTDKREESPNNTQFSELTDCFVSETTDRSREPDTFLLGGNGQADREAPLDDPPFGNSIQLIPRKYVRKKPDIPCNLFKRRASQDESSTSDTLLSVKVKTQSLPGSPNPKGKSHFFHNTASKKREAKSPEESKLISSGRTTVNQILATLNFARFRLEELTGNLGGHRKETTKRDLSQSGSRGVFPPRPPRFVRNDLEKLKKNTERLKLPSYQQSNQNKLMNKMDAMRARSSKTKSNNKGILKSKTALSRTQSSPSSTNAAQQYSGARNRPSSAENTETKKPETLETSPEVFVNKANIYSRDIPFRSASITQSVLKNDPKGDSFTSLRLYPGCKGYEGSNTLPRTKTVSTDAPKQVSDVIGLTHNIEIPFAEPHTEYDQEVSVPYFTDEYSSDFSTPAFVGLEEIQKDFVCGEELPSSQNQETRESVRNIVQQIEKQKDFGVSKNMDPGEPCRNMDKVSSPTLLCPGKPKLKRDKTIEEETDEDLLMQSDLGTHSRYLPSIAGECAEATRNYVRNSDTELNSKEEKLFKQKIQSSISLTDDIPAKNEQISNLEPNQRQVFTENTATYQNEKIDSASLENCALNLGFNSLRKCMSDPSLQSLVCDEPIQQIEFNSINIKQSPTFPPLGSNRFDPPNSRTWHADMMHNLITAAQRKKDCTLFNLQRDTYSFDSVPQDYVHNLDINNSGFPFRRSSLHVFQELQTSDMDEQDELPALVESPKCTQIIDHKPSFSSNEDETTEPQEILDYLNDSAPSTSQDIDIYHPSVILSDDKSGKEFHDSFSEPDTGSRFSISRNTSPGPYAGDSDSGDKQRSPHVPRRYSKRPLRGPYGEMLEAEMSKSKRSSGQFLGEDMYLKLPDSTNTSPRPSSPASPIILGTRGSSLGLISLGETPPGISLPTSRSLDDSTLPMYYASVTTQSDGFLKPGITVQSSESDHEGPTRVPKSFHQRTASSPSKLFFEAGCTSDDEQDMREYIYEGRRSKPHQEEFLTENRSVLVGEHPTAISERSHTIPVMSVKPEDSVSQQAQKKPDGAYYKRKDTRVHIIGELHQTEKSYVENLNFLLTKYLLPLRRPENSHIIEPNLLDDIFFKIPEIHSYHNKLLEELQRRIEMRDQNTCVGDLITQMVQDPHITETYTSYVSNWKTAREATTAASQAKPAFRQFLLARTREHTKKRDLKSLLISIVQRFPHYELILKRLLEYTSRDHQDHELLKEALGEVQKVSASINAVDQEALRLEQQQFILKEISQYTDGSFDSLVQSDREYIQHEQVLFYAGTQGTKERCLFLFSDMLVITSIKRKASGGRKSNSMQLSLFSGLEPYKLRPIYTVSLDDVEIGRSRDDNIKKLVRERESYEEDLATLQKIAQLIKTLHFAKSGLEEALMDSNSSIKKQLGERQNTEAPLRELELHIMTEDGLQSQVYLFNSADKRAKWEDALTLAKQKLASSADRFPLPEFVTALPIRKTRAGLQFTCAAPTLGLYPNNTKDVWVCNSDGYVGQVCVMSVEPEPSVACCNGVCNARIMSIAAVPTPSLSRLPSEDDQEQDNDGDRQSGETEREESMQPTMWLGTEDGSIHVYNCNDTIRTRKNKFKFQPGSPVHCIIYTENKVFASLANGQLIVYHRDTLGSWNGGEKDIVTLSNAAAPVTRMVIAAGKLWCSASNDIKILSIQTLQVEHSLNVGNEASRGVTCMVSAGHSVWIAMNSSAVVKLFHASTYECIQEVNVTPAVKKMLSSCDEIIKQHKSACLRITALLACNDLLWVGTSAGIIITLPLPDLSANVRKPQRPINVVGIPHGHTGHVRFLTFVESGHFEDSSERTKYTTNEKKSENVSKYLVISGGDGYEDFRNTGNTEIAGKEDSTNHLLLWNC